MSLRELIDSLRSRGVLLSVVNADLVVRARKGSMTAADLASIRLVKPQLLELLAASGNATGNLAMRRHHGLDRGPSSFAQEGLWMVDRLQEGSAAYNLPVAYMLHGTLDVKALLRALRELVVRHESLRTRFVEEGDGTLQQVVNAPREDQVEFVDEGSRSEADLGARIAELLSDAARSPFDLQSGPLFKSKVVAFGAQRHLVLLNAHHIVSDGTSMAIVGREISSLYRSFLVDGRCDVAMPGFQYLDFALWQRESLTVDKLEEQSRYWRKKLEGAPRRLPLRRASAGAATGPGRAVLRTALIDEAIRVRISDFARSRGATPFMFYLAACQLLLGRYCGMRDLLLGTPVAGRAIPQTEEIVGLFVNTVVMRGTFEPRQAFEEILEVTRRTALDAYGNQDLPFERLVAEDRRRRDAEGQPLIQAIIAMQPHDAATLNLPGISVEEVPFSETVAKVDLAIYLSEAGGAMRCVLEIPEDLEHREAYEAFGDRLVRLVEECLTAPSTPISDMRTLVQEGYPATFADWIAGTGTAASSIPQRSASYPAHESTQGRFEESIRQVFLETLRVPISDVDADFFDLGGHSMLAVRALAAIRRKTGVDLKLRAIFESPTVRGLAARLAAASDALPTAGAEASQAPITRHPGVTRARQSFAQERMWFLSQLDSGSPAYNLSTAYRILGSLDTSAVRAAVDELIRRHEGLRTRFDTDEDGLPIQIIDPPVANAIRTENLAMLPGEALENAINRVIREESEFRYDLRSGPLFRSRLVQVGEKDHLLIFGQHHIASDGWSQGVLVDEFKLLYSSFVHGKSPTLPEPEIQYVDFAMWQRDWLKGGELSRQIDYWKDALAGAPGVLDIPCDKPRPPVETYRGALHVADLAASIGGAVRSYSRASGCTPFMIFMGAYQMLLSIWSGASDIVVGTPVAGRNHRQTHRLIGLFVNTLVIRAQLTAEQSFDQLMARIRQVALDAYANQDVPFERLVAELKPERDLARHPIFQVAMAMQNMPREALALPDLQMSEVEGLHVVSKFDLSLYVEERGSSFRLGWEYSTDLFEPQTIHRLANAFNIIVEWLTSNPAAALQDLRTVVSPLLKDVGRRAEPPASRGLSTIADMAGVESGPHPSSESEQLVLRAFSDILEKDVLDARANFFSLGGHSLMAARLIVKLKSLSGLDVKLRSLFEYPTVSQLAAWLDRMRAADMVRGGQPPAASDTREEIEI